MAPSAQEKRLFGFLHPLSFFFFFFFLLSNYILSLAQNTWEVYLLKSFSTSPNVWKSTCPNFSIMDFRQANLTELMNLLFFPPYPRLLGTFWELISWGKPWYHGTALVVEQGIMQGQVCTHLHFKQIFINCHEWNTFSELLESLMFKWY